MRDSPHTVKFAVNVYFIAGSERYGAYYCYNCLFHFLLNISPVRVSVNINPVLLPMKSLLSCAMDKRPNHGLPLGAYMNSPSNEVVYFLLSNGLAYVP